MNVRYLLDTNILSDFLNNPGGRAELRLADAVATGSRICTSIIVACESRFGAARKSSMRLTQQVNDLLTEIEVLPFESVADKHYATLRADLEKRGQLIGALDMLIAAHALATDSILITDNVREFSRVQGLRYENWLNG